MKTNLDNASIFHNVLSLKAHFDAMRRATGTKNHNLFSNKLKKDYNRIVMTSGGFDPLHIGHLECIQESAKIANNDIFVVVVNGDSFLKAKKGYIFMPEDERASIISAIRGVDYVVIHEKPGDMTVCEPIEILKPLLFTKGGDRDSFKNVPESEMCMKVGCRVVFNVGGEKIQSSSELVSKAKDYQDK